MRYEPSIDHARILATLREVYDVRAARLHFLPFGYAAACYRVERAGAESLFLKLWPPAPSGEPNHSWRAASLPLLYAIRERGLPIPVPAPLRTRSGALWACAAGIPLALFPFIDGSRPVWTPQLRDTLARTIAALHRATPALADLLPAREDFAFLWAEPLRQGLGQLDTITAQDRPGLRALRDAVLPRRDEVLAQISRLDRLRGVVSLLHGPLVLCHTDIGDDNLLVDRQSQLVVLDWDEARVAPPEYDLYELGAQHGVDFLRAYLAAGGGGPLRRDHVAFALRRRAVGDMAVRFLGILAGGMRNDAEADALAGIEEWGFARWRHLDRILADLAPILR